MNQILESLKNNDYNSLPQLINELILSDTTFCINEIIHDAVKREDIKSLEWSQEQIINHPKVFSVKNFEIHDILLDLIESDKLELFTWIINSKLYSNTSYDFCIPTLKKKEFVLAMVDAVKNGFNFLFYVGYLEYVMEIEMIEWFYNLSINYPNIIKFDVTSIGFYAMYRLMSVDLIKWWLYTAPTLGISKPYFNLTGILLSSTREKFDVWMEAKDNNIIEIKPIDYRKYGADYISLISEDQPYILEYLEELYKDNMDWLCTKLNIGECISSGSTHLLIWLESLSIKYRCDFSISTEDIYAVMRAGNLLLLNFIKDRVEIKSNDSLLVEWAVRCRDNTISLNWLLENTEFLYTSSDLDLASGLGHSHILEFFESKNLEIKFTDCAISSIIDELRCSLGACEHKVLFVRNKVESKEDGIAVRNEDLFAHFIRFLLIRDYIIDLEKFEIVSQGKYNCKEKYLKTIGFWLRNYAKYGLDSILSESSKLFLLSIHTIDLKAINSINISRYYSCSRLNLCYTLS